MAKYNLVKCVKCGTEQHTSVEALKNNEAKCQKCGNYLKYEQKMITQNVKIFQSTASQNGVDKEASTNNNAKESDISSNLKFAPTQASKYSDSNIEFVTKDGLVFLNCMAFLLAVSLPIIFMFYSGFRGFFQGLILGFIILIINFIAIIKMSKDKPELQFLSLNPEDKKNNSGVGFGCITIIVIILSIIIFCGYQFWGGTLFNLFYQEPKIPNSSSETSNENIEAYVAAKQFVTQKLKSPSTAKFPPNYDAQISNLGSGRFSVSGYVDSQNSFGAIVRTKYTVIILKNSSTSWKLESIDIF